MDGNSDVAITAILGVLGTIIAAYLTYRGTVVKTNSDNKSNSKSSRRDDFDVVVDKMKEIIDYQDKQIISLQELAEKQSRQIEEQLHENNQLRSRINKMITEITSLKQALSSIPNIDTELIAKIEQIHASVVSES